MLLAFLRARRGARLRRCLTVLAAFVASGLPSSAWAIPTPESLVVGARLLPALWAGLLALFAGFAWWRVKSRSDRRLIYVLLVGLVVSWGLLLGEQAEDHLLKQQRAVAAEFRCDVSYHANRTAAASLLRARGGPWVGPLSGLREAAAAPGHLTAWDLRLSLWQAAGAARFRDAHGDWLQFDPVAAPDLLDRLRALPPETTLLLTVFRPTWLMDIPTSDRVAVLELLDALHSVKLAILDQGTVVALRPDEFVVESAPTRGRWRWASTAERFLIDPSAVAFPNATSVLEHAEAAQNLSDPSIMILAPFNSVHRDAETYIDDFLSKYLTAVPQDRIVVVDYGAADFSSRFLDATGRLAGRSFICVGYSKFDCKHYGLDVAFAASKFGAEYLGRTDSLSDVLAYQAVRSRSLVDASLTKLQAAFGVATVLLARSFELSVPLAWLVLGLLARLALLPLTLVAARSRLTSRRIRAVSRLPGQGYLKAHAVWLERLVGRQLVFEVLEFIALAVLSVGVWPVLASFEPAGVFFLVGVGVVGLAARTWTTRRHIATVDADLLCSRPSTASEGLPNLVAATPDRHGTKAARLAWLRGCRTKLFSALPGTVWRPEHDDVFPFPSASETSTFAVRSSSSEEDLSASSHAGAYLTELDVAARDVHASAMRVAAGLSGGAVVIQPFRRFEIGGVLFTQAPEHPSCAAIEWSDAGPAAVTSGRQVPNRLLVCRRTGIADHSPDQYRTILERLFVVGARLESLLGRPQDIEWGYGEGELVLLQCRDVPPQDIALESAERERMLAIHPGYASSPLMETGARPSILTASLLTAAYGSAGALRRSLAIAQLPADRYPQPVIGFGRIWEPERRDDLWRDLRRRWAYRRLRQQLENDPTPIVEGVVAQLEQCAMLQQEGRPLDRLITGLDQLTQRVLCPSIAASLLAGIAPVRLDRLPAGLRHRLRTAPRTAELFRDLAELSHGGGLEPFLERWGHRAAEDYELSVPTFAQAPLLALVAAEKVGPWAGPTSAPDDIWVLLKEWSKDMALRHLANVRRAFFEVAHELQIPPSALSACSLADLRALKGGAGVPAVSDLQRRRKVWGRLQDVPLPHSLSEEALLFGSSTGRSEGDAGFFVGRVQPFHGQVVSARDEDAVGPTSVVVAETLDPSLVRFFGRTRGCIVARGGALCHAAIVAREIGYPILVCDSAKDLRPGQKVTVRADGRLVVGATAGARHQVPA